MEKFGVSLHADIVQLKSGMSVDTQKCCHLKLVKQAKNRLKSIFVHAASCGRFRSKQKLML